MYKYFQCKANVRVFQYLLVGGLAVTLVSGGEPTNRGAGSIFTRFLIATSTVSVCQRLFGSAECLLLILTTLA